MKQTDVKWNITDAFPNGGDLSKVFPPEQELKESYEYEGKTYGTRKAIGAGIYLRHVWGTMVPAFYKDPKEIILPMLIHGFILPKTRKWGCGLSFRIIVVLRWTWLHYRESGIIKAVEYGLMIKK